MVHEKFQVMQSIFTHMESHNIKKIMEKTHTIHKSEFITNIRETTYLNFEKK